LENKMAKPPLQPDIADKPQMQVKRMLCGLPSGQRSFKYGINKKI